MDQVIAIARQLRSRSLAKNLAGSVKEILGTVRSIGVTVDGKSPAILTEMINKGEIEIPAK